MTSDDEDIEPPYLKGFVMILPQGIPLPDRTVWSFETDELEPLLDQHLFVPTSDSRGPRPSDGVGRNFVSLRFWQLEDETEPPFESDLHHLRKAFARVHPLPEEASGTDDPPDTGRDGVVRYRTAVEAVTFVARTEDLIATADKPDPLTRCLDKLFDWHRAYRVIAKTPVEELTYQQLFPVVATFRRKLNATKVAPDGLMHLASSNFRFGALAEHIGTIDQNLLAVGLARLRLGDPVMSFVERRIGARHELLVKGDYGNAVIQQAVACEVILDGLLGLMLWEDGVNEADAATIFSSDIIPRLRNQYACRLGGNWQLETGGLSSWDDHVATMRNRVVHGGYRPTRAEAVQASDSVDSLAEFISDRLCDNFRTYPKTIWLFVGSEGLKKRNRLSRRVQSWIAEQPPNAVLQWVRDYADWRDRVNSQIQRRRKSGS